MDWSESITASIRRESFFGDRVVRCFPDRPKNFDDLIRRTIAAHPEREAFAHREQRLTYREFDERLDRIAGNLARYGVAKGDRVGVLADNSLAFMLATFGAIRLGAIAVPMGTRQQKPELDYVFNHCGLKALVHDAYLADRLPDAAATPALKVRFAIGEETSGSRPFADLLKPVSAPFAVVDIAETDPAMIMYTSGTTGRPKGAILPHLAFVHTGMHFVNCLDHRPTTRALLAIPASHISGLGAIVTAMLRAGGSVVIADAFKARDFLAQMAREKITFTVLVPAMYKLCLMEPEFDSHDLSDWTIGLFGGAIMPPAVIATLAEKLPKLDLINAYGATETTSPATIMPPGLIHEAPDSIGKTVPCGEIRVMDDAGREVPAGESGELWINGPMVAQGYWNNPEATRENFVAGFWRSGDIGSIDTSGFVRVFDRKKDMINRAGYKVFSAEVENTLNYHPDVVECIVVPSPDPVLGERVHAFVCARIDSLSPDDLRAFCLTRIADYKIPDIWTIGVEPLPRNANGKFQKMVMRDQARAMAENSVRK